ncbi:hypothetical protein ACFLXU_07355, partial [Chloroflexota bacterium]
IIESEKAAKKRGGLKKGLKKRLNVMLRKSGRPENLTLRSSRVEESTEEDTIGELDVLEEEVVAVLPPVEDILTEKETAPPLSFDTDAIFTGEIIELCVAKSVNSVALSTLYKLLQSTAGMKILSTGGSWDEGTNITVSLDKPLPLISMITKIPGITIIPKHAKIDRGSKTSTDSLLGVGRDKVTKITLNLEEG